MRPATRRVWFFWLLLLLPALGGGVVAIQLLRREQARIAQQGAEVIEARQAAAAARARLIVENIELLVGDVQDGLLEALAMQPADELERFMREWETSNPLVKTTFIARPDGALVRPTAAALDDEARGFRRRFDTVFRDQPPWQGVAPAPAAVVQEKAEAEERDARSRREVTSNVAQVQSARRDVQELLKARNYQSVPASVSAPESKAAGPLLGGVSSGPSTAKAKTSSNASSAGVRRQSVDAPQAVSDAVVESADSPAATLAPPAIAPAVERRGWTARAVEGRLHLLGWVQLAGENEVRGVELDLAALVARLGRALPAEVGAGEGFVLRDTSDRVIHQVGLVPRGEQDPAVRVPLANGMLAGWAVTGHLPLGLYSGHGGGGFFIVGAVLVGIFVAAILLGGSLLLWQARRSEAEAAQKTSFVANVSHEFKTPLTTIRLYAELLEQGRVRDERQGADYLRTIGRETERLARLVNNALDFSRLEQGQKKYARERLELGAELTRLLDTHAPRVGDAGLELKRALPAEPLFVMADRDAVEQIVLNLIDNACKYAESGGEVVVSAAGAAAGGAEVRVADRGPGVPTDQRERIFDKFHRVNDALTAEKTGAGLGLSIARQLARGLGGELRHEPRDGGGAVFILTLP